MFAGRNMLFVMGAAGSSPHPSGTASLTVTWDDNSAIEDGFRVRYRTAGSGSYTLATTTAANIETATITGLAFGTNYDVTVAAFNGSGEYSVVGPVTRYTPPAAAPTSLSATTTLSTSITVGFTAAAGVSNYQGYYRATGSSTWITGPAITTGAAITFTGLNSLTSYQFKIRGYLANPSPQAPSYSPDSATLTASTAQGWDAARSIVDIGETIVETTGTLVIAENFGETTNRTVNGVTFTGVTSKGNMPNAYVTSEFFTDTSLPAGFTGMMRSLIYTEADALGQFTLTGLVSGDAYMLQVFSSDNRTTLGDRSQTINVASMTSSANVLNTRYAMTCRFIASATSHVVSIDDPANATGANHIQAYQLRKL